ncbi:MAG TPA: autotransporter domain-containing protein, partial [Pararobbsia sp.]|nr:autotransporter domain-containing protein [Pararobbsia sp.]
LTLNGANTYTGKTIVNAGTLALGANASLAATGTVDLASGAIFDLSAGNGQQVFGTLVGGGTVILGSNDLTLGSNANGTYSGSIGGDGSVTKVGTGTETLTGASTYTGGTTIDAGTLALGLGGSLAATGVVALDGATTGFDISGSGANQTIGALSGTGGTVTLGVNTLTFGDGSDQTLASTIVGTGGIVKQGAGTETLSAANTFTGGTTIDAGTLALSGAGALAATGAVDIAGPGASFDISNASGNQTVGALAGAAGTTLALGVNTLTFGDATDQTLASAISGTGGLIKNGSGIETVTGANTYSGGTTLNAGGLVVGNNAALGSGTLTVAGAATLDSATPTTLASNIVLNAGLTVPGSNALTLDGAIAGTGSLTKDGPATLTLDGVETYTGGTQINGGTLALGAGASLAPSGAVGVASGATFDLTASTASQTIGSLTGAGTVDLGANTLTFGDTTNATFGGTIAGTGGITKDGSGTVTLSGANTFTGPATIDAGTLSLSGAGTLSAATPVTLANTGTSLDISTATGSPTIGSLSGVTGSTVTLGGNTLTLGGGADGTYSGTLSGTGGLVKEGAGTQALLSANTYSGGTTLAGGTLVVGNNAALGTGGLTVAAPATLDATTAVTLANPVALDATLTAGGSANLTLANTVSGTGGLVKNGAADLTLSTDNSFSGGTVVNGGSLTLGASGALGTGSLTMNGGTLNFGTPSQTTSLAVVLDGLNGAAGTTINLGSSSLTVNGGGMFGGALTGTGSVIKDGDDTLTLGGTNTYSGPTTIAGGTLDVTGSAANTIVSVDAGATLTGSGAIGGLVVHAGGTAAAPATGQNINVSGNATLEAGSTLQVPVTPTQSGGLATTGTTTLGGGTVDIVAGAGVYMLNTVYPIITATGGLTGTFSGATSTLPFLTPALNYGPDTASVTLNPNTAALGSAGNTPNEAATASAITSMPATGAMLSALYSSDTISTAQRAFAMLDGELHASTTSMLLSDSGYVRDAVTDRLRQGLAPSGGPLSAMSSGSAACDDRLAHGASPDTSDAVHGGSRDACVDSRPYRPVVWAQAYGADGGQAGDVGTSSIDRTTTGFIGGADMALNDTWRVGVAGGFAHSSLDNGLNSSAQVDTYHIALYGGAQYGPLGIRLGASYSLNDINMDRYPAFTGFSDHDGSEYWAKTAQIFGEVGFAIPINRFAVEPFVNLAYVNVHTNGFTESGGESALTAGSQSNNLGYSTMGFHFATALGEVPFAALSAHATTGWRHAFGNVQASSTVAFVSGGTSFDVNGVPIARDAAVVELGVDANVTKNLTFGLAYGGQYGGGTRDNSISGRFAWKF